MSDLEDVKEDLERICAEGDVLCCAALKCIRELEAAQGVGRPDVWASHMCRELRQAGYLVPYERMVLTMQTVGRALAGQGGE